LKDYALSGSTCFSWPWPSAPSWFCIPNVSRLQVGWIWSCSSRLVASGLSGGFCEESDPQVSALPLALMNQLYDIERRATQKSDQERGELRAKESRRILDRLGEYLEGPVAKSVLPASKLGGLSIAFATTGKH
jgi:hypothetical protein